MATDQTNIDVDILEKIIREQIKKGADAEYKIPFLDRILKNYELLKEGDVTHKIDFSKRRNLKVAIMLYALYLDETEDPRSFLKEYKSEDIDKKDENDIIFAVEYCRKDKRIPFIKSKQAAQEKNIIASLLALVVYMDELGAQDYGLYMAIENYFRKNGKLDMFGEIPSGDLRAILEMHRITARHREFLEEKVEKDNSVLSVAILDLITIPHLVMLIGKWLSQDIKEEVERRISIFRKETEKVLRRKEKNELSLSPKN